MKKLFFIFSLGLICCSAISAQTAKPTPPPPSDEEDVVKITTSLIQLDVTVTDKKGKIITDLRPDEIQVYENGSKKKISNFSFISSIRESQQKAEGKKPATPATVIPSGPPRVEKVRRTIALVVDDLTLSVESARYARQALVKFINEQMEDGDLVAIIRTGAGIGALQQFTTDKRQLYAAAERVRWNPAGIGKLGAFAPMEAKIINNDSEEAQGVQANIEKKNKEMEEMRNDTFAVGTIGALGYIVRGMEDLPGRKSIMLISDGFKLYTEDSFGHLNAGSTMQKLQRLIDRANRAAVVIYTMDARGLQYTERTSQDVQRDWTDEEAWAFVQGRQDLLYNTQDAMKQLARGTGGLAYLNSNDLSKGIRKALDDQSYYLLGYEPDDSTFDPKTARFNKLEVKVTRPGTMVRYRSGFFGVTDDKIQKPVETPAQRLSYALTSPFAMNEISMRMNTLYYNAPKEGNVLRSLVHIRAGDLTFNDMPDGSKVAKFDFIGVAFGDNGRAVDQISKTYMIPLKPDVYERVRKNGFVYNFVFPIKKPGAYQLRVAIRDHETNRLGSANQFIEVPNVGKGRLVLSGTVLENYTAADYQRRVKMGGSGEDLSNPVLDTTLRQFKRGTVMTYSFNIYNAKTMPAPNLSYQTRIYRDGNTFFEGQVRPLPLQGSADPTSVGMTGSLTLGADMEPGEYILQVSVVDNLAKKKSATAVQFIPFEIIE
jgi:VWFA-related protein